MNKELYFIKPSNSRKFHIFDKNTGRSLCNSWGWFGNYDEEDKVKGIENYGDSEDCKTCFKRAGLFEQSNGGEVKK